MGKTIKEAFDEKFYVTPGCWIWTASCSGNGRPKINVDGRTRVAAQIAYELYKGPILDGLHVLHKCDNPVCVNPYHLFLGTHQDNMKDMVSKGRSPKNTKGEDNCKAKLTWEVVRKIRQIIALDKPDRRDIASLFGVTRELIGMIDRNEIWRE